MAMSGATIDAALAAERKSAPSREVRFLVFQVFLVVICSGVVVPAKASAGVVSEPFMMLRVCIYVCVSVYLLPLSPVKCLFSRY